MLICGGDGTVGWVLSCLDDVVQEMKCKLPASAVLPIGIGKWIFSEVFVFPTIWRKFISRVKSTFVRFVFLRYVIDFKTRSTNLVNEMEI